MQVTKIAHFKGHQGSVYALQKLNETEFLSGSGDHHLVLWNLNNEKEGTLLATLPSGIYSLLLVNDNNLIVGTGNGDIHLIDMLSKKQVHAVKPHQQTVFSLSFAESKNYILSSGGDGLLNILDASTLELIKSFHLGNFKVRCSLINREETVAYIGCGDGTVVVLDLNALFIIHKFAAHGEGFSVNALAFSVDENLLYSASRDARINVFDIKNKYHLLESIPAHNYAIYGIMYSPSKKMLATISRDKTAKLWPEDEWKVLARLDKEKLDGHTHSVNTMTWITDNILLTAGDDRSIIAWQIS